MIIRLCSLVSTMAEILSFSPMEDWETIQFRYPHWNTCAMMYYHGNRRNPDIPMPFLTLLQNFMLYSSKFFSHLSSFFCWSPMNRRYILTSALVIMLIIRMVLVTGLRIRRAYVNGPAMWKHTVHSPHYESSPSGWKIGKYDLKH